MDMHKYILFVVEGTEPVKSLAQKNAIKNNLIWHRTEVTSGLCIQIDSNTNVSCELWRTVCHITL